MTRRLSSVALAPILLLAACGGGSSSQPVAASGASSQPAASAPGASAASTDGGSGPAAGDVAQACELLSDADILELTTWEVDTVEPGSTHGIFENGCDWMLAGGTSAGMGAPASITLGVLGTGGREYYDTYFAPFIEENGDEPLEGVGDVGLIGSLSGTAMAVQGDVLVDVQWIDLGSDETPVAVALLERVVANLAGN
jgi:hypothetical protein